MCLSLCLSVLSVNRGAVSPPKGHEGLERKLSSSLPTSPRMAIPQRSHNSATYPPSEELEQEVDSTQQKLRALLRRRRPSCVQDSPIKRDTMSSSCPVSAIATPKRTGSFGRLSELYSPTSSSSTLRLHPGTASDSALQTVQSREHVSSETGQVSSDLLGQTESTCSREEGGLARRTTSVCSTGTLVASTAPMLGESETGLKPVDLNQCEGQPTHLSRSRVKMSPLEHLDLCLQSGADLHFFEETEWV